MREAAREPQRRRPAGGRPAQSGGNSLRRYGGSVPSVAGRTALVSGSNSALANSPTDAAAVLTLCWRLSSGGAATASTAVAT